MTCNDKWCILHKVAIFEPPWTSSCVEAICPWDNKFAIYGAETCIIQLVRNLLLFNLIDTSRKTQEIYFAHKMCTKTSYYVYHYGGPIIFSPSTHGYQFVWKQSKPSLYHTYLIQMVIVIQLCLNRTLLHLYVFLSNFFDNFLQSSIFQQKICTSTYIKT